MARYRRNYVGGGCYFFTVNLADRASSLLVHRIVELRSSLSAVRRLHPFHIDAWVILPEHMHCVWTLPEGDLDYAGRWRDIKGRFSRSIPEVGKSTASLRRRNERGIWQRRFWEHTISSEADYIAHINYVHLNPVKHGYVAKVIDWPFSTFHRYVKEGIYAADARKLSRPIIKKTGPYNRAGT